MSLTANHTSAIESEIGPRESVASDAGVDFLDLALALVQDRRRIAVITVAAFVLGALISLILKPDFWRLPSFCLPNSSNRRPPWSWDSWVHCWEAEVVCP